eukprot:scaffold140220_cov32-Tisochrysis_lutea.AAC.1
MPSVDRAGLEDYVEKLPEFTSFMIKWAKASLISLKMVPTDEECAEFGNLCRWCMVSGPSPVHRGSYPMLGPPSPLILTRKLTCHAPQVSGREAHLL